MLACVPPEYRSAGLGPASDATVATNRTSAGFLLKTLRIRKPRDVRTFKRRLRAPLASSLSNFRRSDRRSKSGRPLTHRRHFDLLVEDERIAAIEPASAAASAHFPAIDLEAHHVWPTLIDMHAHLDKGHIVTRTKNPDGSFAGALQSTAEDRTHRWTAEDIKRRMVFGLRCSPQQTHPGSGKLGTHLSEWDHRCVVAKDRSPLNRAGPDGVLRTAGVGA